jgi:hypothetical protein
LKTLIVFGSGTGFLEHISVIEQIFQQKIAQNLFDQELDQDG